jgi:hypothetical protein
VVRRAARHRRGPTRRAAITHHSLKILHQQVGLACRAPATPDKGRAASGVRSSAQRGAKLGWIYPQGLPWEEPPSPVNNDALATADPGLASVLGRSPRPFEVTCGATAVGRGHPRVSPTLSLEISRTARDVCACARARETLVSYGTEE